MDISENGRGGQIRTDDPHTPSVVRYQTALRPDLIQNNNLRYFKLLKTTELGVNMGVTPKHLLEALSEDAELNIKHIILKYRISLLTHNINYTV